MNPNIVASYALVAELKSHGVSHCVISPGSRSTPISHAAYELLDSTVVIDERSAGFVGLGIAESTNTPVVVITTSGSAPTHLYPSVVEAFHAHVPMIYISADRPHEVRGRGAPQTIDQSELFSHSVQLFIDSVCPHDNIDDDYWGTIARDLYSASVGHDAIPGPVHLNMGFREPLTPDGDELIHRQGETLSVEKVHDKREVELPDSLRSSRGLITVGRHFDGDPRDIHALSEATGWPICADILSQLRDGSVITTYDTIVRRNDKQFLPDIIVEIGEPLTSKKFHEFMAGVETIALKKYKDSRDPYGHHSSEVVASDISQVLKSWARLHYEDDPLWRQLWVSAETHSLETIARVIQQQPDSEPAVLAAIGDICAKYQDHLQVLIASSMPIRYAEWFWNKSGPDTCVLSHRGTNGIDGMISSTYGIAHGSCTTTLCVLGDVAFSHDVGFLSAAQQISLGRNESLIFVVIDNAGGAIFRHLDQAQNRTLKNSYAELFQTTPAVDIEKMCHATGVTYIHGTPHDYKTVLDDPQPGVTVVHICVEHESGPEFMRALDNAIG